MNDKQAGLAFQLCVKQYNTIGFFSVMIYQMRSGRNMEEIVFIKQYNCRYGRNFLTYDLLTLRLIIVLFPLFIKQFIWFNKIGE